MALTPQQEHLNTCMHRNTMQLTATHRNKHEASFRMILSHQYIYHNRYTLYNTLQHNATHCNTLQHTATHCNTLQHAEAHYNTQQNA